jgi:hypothetical protein
MNIAVIRPIHGIAHDLLEQVLLHRRIACFNEHNDAAARLLKI